MGPRVAEKDRLKHKVLIRLTDDQYGMLLEETRARDLAPTIIARLAFVQGLPVIRRKRQRSGRECGHARRNTKGEMA